MKKLNAKLLIFTLLVILFSTIVTGCNNSKNSSKTANVNKGITKEDYKFPSDVKITDGTAVNAYINSENSENGHVPVLMVDENNALVGISLTVNKFDSDKDVYIFINKKFVDKIKGDTKEQQSINLEKPFLTVGDKTIEAVQFEDNDATKSVVKYNEVKFIIKNK